MSAESVVMAVVIVLEWWFSLAYDVRSYTIHVRDCHGLSWEPQETNRLSQKSPKKL